MMQFRRLWILVVVTAVVTAVTQACKGPKRKVAEGEICGVTTKDYHKYAGIPYAEPPIGTLRWKNPQPKRPWKGVLSCTKHCHECLQSALFTSVAKGHEDCLCLNVYVPKVQNPKNLPVMVWIHGGAFVGGSGNSDMYNPKRLVAEGVIAVTLNYRLGTLGFLNFGTPDAPGNQGLMDQFFALKWVKKNIKVFGGDPDKITIFGESAGSVSVHMHTLSPLSRNYFVRAIAQSGSALNPWAFNETTSCSNEKLLAITNCPAPKGNDTSATFECLRRVDGKKLQAPTSQFICPDKDKSGGLLAFSPSLDGQFLPSDPMSLATQCNSVSMMVGCNSAEGIITLPTLRVKLGYQTWTKHIQNGYGMDQLGVNCSMSTDLLSKWGALARKHFLNDQDLSEANVAGFVRYSSYFSFIWGMNLAINQRASCPNAKPQYLYVFDSNTILNHAKQLFGGVTLQGAAHADELAYLFDFAVDVVLLMMPKDAKMTQKRMVKLWANYAKYGNPTPQTDKLLTSTWPAYSTNESNYLLINNAGIHASKNPFAEDTRFYEQIISECK
ncbi:hypothetical protein R5R35_008603 [Gryllus longicercus]|uniref:Carboxylic ester hydrolase n=1 Tax=Gryllus longicercus TaxID=2509291 RepID=A0AAN9YVC3_9ORTH